jgi:hypothetical protein
MKRPGRVERPKDVQPNPARSPVRVSAGIGSLKVGADVGSVVKGHTTIESFGVESVVLNDDGWTGLAGVSGTGGDGPDFTAPHSSPQAEIASTNAWSSAA